MYNSISYMLNFYYPYLDNLLCLKVDLLYPLYPKHRRFLDTANIATTSPGPPVSDGGLLSYTFMMTKYP